MVNKDLININFNFIRTLFLSILLVFLSFSFSAQEIRYDGKVTDSLQNPIPHTNLIATPLVESEEITFAITDNQGRYKLNLVQEIAYKIEITHMGFSKLTDTIQFSANATRDYVLLESTESLEQVVIKQEMAVVVKEDTITYRTDQFKTGEERKLREVLKKLPGVEVDREGNVTVNGKKVTKLMVEGKTFFTGDTKLGVNNIPADAVDEVEALDNYNEVSFLKGLSDSDQMALNIKLKEGKKEFIFGDIEAGAGIKERYLLHPTLFYYSPKTAVNVIGDFNNIGKKSFSMSDYIKFEGGYASMMEGDNSFSDIYNSDFAQFLRQEDFVYNKNDFGAGSISQQINPNLRLEAYSIVSKGKTETLTTNQLTYLTGNNIEENRETSGLNKVFFTLNKLKLRYQPTTENDLAYDAFVKTSQGDAQQNLISEQATEVNKTQILQMPSGTTFTNEIRYNKQFSYEHTSTLTGFYQYKESDNNRDWLFDQPVFSGIIPFINDADVYNLIQETDTKNHHANLNLKHYWVLNNFNHIYPKVGVHFYNQAYGTNDFQQLQNGSINSFQNSGFNNDLNFRLVDSYFGFQYKAKAGDFIFKPGLVYHSYLWKEDQFQQEIANNSLHILLPELNVEYEISDAESFELDYNLNTSFASAQQYANRLRLLSFNRLYRGNADLENQLYHSTSLSYRQFNLYRGIFMHASFNYIRREKSVRSTTLIEGIDQIQSSIYTELPENNYSFTGSFSKQIPKYKFTLSGTINFADYSRIVNLEQLDYNSKIYRYNLKTETRFKEWPNLEVGLKQSFSDFESGSFMNKFQQLEPYVVFNWDFLNDFIAKAEYSYNYYENLNTNQVNRFQIGSASLFYNKEDSPWGFEIDVDNIFDVRYKNQNSFSQFLVTDRNIYIQPRTILFKISYKL